MQIQILPREPNAFETVLGETTEIKAVGHKLNNPSSQHLALRDLGVRLTDTNLSISFKETGFAYLDPFGDRNLLESQKSTQSFTLNFSLALEPLYPLSVAVDFEPFFEDCVNFFGNVTVKTPNGEKRMLPLTGRGTVALEGRKNDAHAGFATGGACASFQNRCCFILAVAAASGAGMAALHQIGQEFWKIDERYHGRSDCLKYAIFCSQTPLRDRISYANFLEQLYPRSRWSPVLTSINDENCLPQCYYNAVLQKLSPSELEEDRQRCFQVNQRERERLFSPEDGIKMLFAKRVMTILPKPNKWTLPSDKFHVTPEVGDALVSPRARRTPLSIVLQNLCNVSEISQSDLLLDLGIEIEGHQLRITVHENGCSLVENARGKSDEMHSASLTLNFSHDLQLPVKLEYTEKASILDGVNYFGGLNVQDQFFMPLVGRGTINLDQLSGSSEHALPVISGKIASFLTKCAIVLAVCKCFGASPYQLGQVKELFCSIDYKLYKQPEIILYYHECLKYPQNKMPSFTAFLSTIYEEKMWSDNLKHLVKKGYPHESYFSTLKVVLTAQELAKCLKRHETRSANPKKLPGANGVMESDILIAFFPYTARLGNSFQLTSGKKVSIEETLRSLSSENLDQQLQLLDIVVRDGKFQLSFAEDGNPYLDQSADRSKTFSDVSCQISIKLPLPVKSSKALKLSALLEHFSEGGVNYLGKLLAENLQGERRVIPLVGRGTVALEGQESGDTHAGLATGGACATFQNRAAAILGAGFALGLEEGALKQIYYTLCHVNSCYHGRKSSLDYIMYCISTSEKNRKSYYKYMLETSEESELNCLMVSLRDKNEICEATLAKVKSKLTAEEQQEDLDALDTGLHEHELHSHADDDDCDDVSPREQNSTSLTNAALHDTDDDSRHVHFNLDTEVISVDPESKVERGNLRGSISVPVQSGNSRDTCAPVASREEASSSQETPWKKAPNCVTTSNTTTEETSNTNGSGEDGRPYAEDLDAFDTGLHEHELHSHADGDDCDDVSPREQNSTSLTNAALHDTDDDSRHVHFNLDTEVISVDPESKVERGNLRESISVPVQSGNSRDTCAPVASREEASSSQETPWKKAPNCVTTSNTTPKETSSSVPPTNGSGTDSKNNEFLLSEKHNQLLRSISHHLNPTTIKVKPRVGTLFTNFLGRSFSIYDVVTTFRDHQSQGLSMLGITVDKGSRTFNLVFREDGRPYAEPSGNRAKLGPETVTEKYYSCRLANPPPPKLDVLVSLVPFEQDGVNYLGRITFNSPLNEYRVIPLVGRGTVALEAKDQSDAKCTPCITGSAATFQQRIALCFASLAAAGGTAQDLDDLSVSVKSINDLYHGRDDLFFYTLQCAKKSASSVPSYLKFISLTSREEERSGMLRSMITRGVPSEDYYAQLVDVLSREELMQDRI